MLTLTPKQNEYIRNANARWNLKVGAVRSGKSYVDITYTIPYRLREVADKKGLAVIMGVSRETIERNVLQPMREQYTSRLVGTINNRNIAMVCGQEVYCIGAEKVSQVAKIHGSSIKYCYGDEIARWNKEVFTMLESRLDKPYSKFDGACNPEHPTHWLKEFIDRDDLNMYLQHYTLFDNMYLPKQFVEDLCNEYKGTVYYPRYIMGEWTRAEGLIYPMYDDAIIDDLSDDYIDYSTSIDYGTQNAFAVILWAYNGTQWHAIAEYYYSGRDKGIQKADDEYANDLDKFTDWLYEKDENGHQIMNRKLEVIIDPSAASFKAMLQKRGRYRVRDADNDVLNGIRETATCMNRGKIKIHKSLKNWQKEVAGYTWEDDDKVERPVKVDDHLMDATRYFVKTKRIAKEKRNADISRPYRGW